MEETEAAVAFASGMAAFHASVLASGVRPGQTIVAARDLYGTSRNVLVTLFQELGFNVALVDATRLDEVDRMLSKTGAALFCFEPLSNPLLKVADVAGLLAIARRNGTTTLVDNTFCSPFLLQPASLGADLVIHSATKYLGGHGDVVAGVVACSEDLATKLRSLRTSIGGVLGPFEAWLVLRGLRTLPLRMQRHCENALQLAYWLSDQSPVEKVHYPGLDSANGAETAQFRNGLGGGMLAFETALSADEAEAFMDALKLAVPGTSLGDVETLVLYPARSSHRTLTLEEREAAGITEGLLRVSVGLEAIGDLIEDFGQALASVYTPIATQPAQG